MMSVLLENPTQANNFFVRWNEFIQKGDSWAPKLLSDIDLVLTNEKLFPRHWSFDSFIDSVRYVYVNESYDARSPQDYRYTYTAKHISLEIQRFLPTYEFTTNQIALIEQEF